MKTKRLTFVTLTAAALLLFSSAGWTADDDAEATIRLMDTAEADETEAVTKVLAIPVHLMQASQNGQDKAIEKAEKGLKNAADNGEKKGFDRAGMPGRGHPEDANDRKLDMSEKAGETRENKSRADDRPERPELPEPPPGQN